MVIALVVIGHVGFEDHHLLVAVNDFEDDNLDVEELVAFSGEDVGELVVEHGVLEESN